MRKVDAIDKMRGVARYTDDLHLPGMLHARLVRSPYAHAKILSIDPARALAMTGVHAVITGADLPTRFGILPWTQDETALAQTEVRHVGEAVACVAAIDEDTAIAAGGAIAIEYEPLPAIFDPEAAIAAGQVSKHVELGFGDVEGALAGADLVIEDTYRFAGTTHAALEPHCALATVDGTGVLTVWSTTQVSHYLHRTLARVLDLPARAIRVIQPPLGGAFGGKSEPFDYELCAAKLALVTGRPVKCLSTREEVFYRHRGRHPMTMRYRAGFTRDGKITGVDARTVIDGGAFSSFGLVTTYYAGQLLAAPYDLPAYHFIATRAFTAKPACGPKRGHGSVQPRFAFESQLDQAAHALAIDPIELRRRNALAADATTVNGLRIGSNGFLECLARVEAASGWRERRGRLPRGRGLGVAGSCYISGTNYPIYPNDLPQAAVQVTLDRSGRARLFTGANDLGQGSSTVLALLVADELGLELADVRVLAADTDLCPVDLGAYSSRVTLMVGNACLSAARALRARVATSVGRRWEAPPDRVGLVAREAIDVADPTRRVPIAEAFQWAEADHGLLSAAGNYDTPKDRHGSYRGATIGASPAYSFTAHVAEVEVDLETGVVRPVEIWAAHDCGRALSRPLVEAQIEGSVAMGLAEALSEEHVIDAAHGGVHAGPSLLDYRLPTALDTPPIHPIIVEAPDPQGPHGAKEAGEGPLHPIIPAIANAIFDAIGVRLTETPFTPARVLAALAGRRGVAASAERERSPAGATPAPAKGSSRC